MAKVYRHPRSKYYQAVFQAWDAAQGKFVQRMQSTKAADKATALSIAREFEKVARAVAPHDGHATWTRESALDAVNAILRLAGAPTVIETRSFQDYAASWLESIKSRTRSGAQYASYIKMFGEWLPGPTPLNRIDADMLTRWHAEMVEQGRSVTTLKLVKDTLRRIFDRAKYEGFCQRNPADLLQVSASPPAARETFSATELTKLLTHLEREGLDDWRTLVLVGLCTAQRMRDCARMMWSQIEGDVWACRQSKSARKGSEGKLVRVPIVEPLRSHLAAHRARATALYVMPSLSKAPAGMSIQFTRLLEASGIQLATTAKRGPKANRRNRLSFHCLRHTTNSLMANAGISQDVRRAILGHANEAINSIYTHMDDATTADGLAAALKRFAL